MKTRFIVVRRVVRMAVEDIGLADPQALTVALAAKDAFELMGSPEGELAIAQAVLYVATAPKSNAVYTAFKAAQAEAKRTGSLMPPKHILNAPTKLMKAEGYGAGYAYDHDAPEGSPAELLPDNLPRPEFYRPRDTGFRTGDRQAPRLVGGVARETNTGELSHAYRHTDRRAGDDRAGLGLQPGCVAEHDKEVADACIPLTGFKDAKIHTNIMTFSDVSVTRRS